MEQSYIPKVSIIIPVYNVDKYLEECLQSLIDQTLYDIEIICVNDASTDHSLDILNRYAKLDKRIVIINNSKNSGPSFARNRGIEKANGEFIYFLDADDMIIAEAMDELYNLAREQKLDGILFDTTPVFQTKALEEIWCRYKTARSNIYLDVFKGSNLFTELVHNGDYDVTVWRQFWNRHYLIDNNLFFYEEIIHEDFMFTFFSIMKAKKLICLNKKYHIYFRRENSITTGSIPKEKFEGLFICYCKIISFIMCNRFKNEVLEAIDQYISELYELVKHSYKLVKYTNNAEKIKFKNVVIQHSFERLKSNMNEVDKSNSIIESNLEVIKQFKKVVIYGAGAFAIDALEILSKYKIDVYAFAVSDKSHSPKELMGKPIYNIDELVEYKDEAIVLVAVSKCYHKDILFNLEKLKYKNSTLV